ncbi:hypothetical protein [uncultured Paracoccus sp.]|uniref:hypothetical protein n=1 Tax=uncultured Paracoccus sp. TaxID=189685 RepID=UPI0025D9B9F0|nr:hypothetical protein [uncultured Paracoccus sp.]
MSNIKTILHAIAVAVPVFCGATAMAEDAPSLGIVWPQEGMVVPIGADAEGVIGVVVHSNFRLAPAGTCGSDPNCGHVHMKIDPEGNDCDIPGRNYNSMNSDFGGNLIVARFGHCSNRTGEHVIGVLLANDHHQPILVDGQPVTALVRVTTETMH